MELLGTVPVELPNVNNHVHIVLGIGFYVNFVLLLTFMCRAYDIRNVADAVVMSLSADII